MGTAQTQGRYGCHGQRVDRVQDPRPTKTILANSTMDWRGALASILSGRLRYAAMTTGTALRHSRIGDPALL